MSFPQALCVYVLPVGCVLSVLWQLLLMKTAQGHLPPLTGYVLQLVDKNIEIYLT